MPRTTGVIAVLLLTGCSYAPRQKEAFPDLAQEFVYTSLAFSPITATQTGYHRHGGQQLDELLDDYSPGTLDRQREWYANLRLRLLRSVEPGALSPEDRADYDIIQNQISLALLEYVTIQSYRHNPTLYVELAGNALYTPWVLKYAPDEERYRHIVSRMKRLPQFLAQARLNLESSPAVWTGVAVEENDATAELIQGTLTKNCPPALRPEFDAAARTAVAELAAFSEWLRTDLSRRRTDWRLGRDRYGQKFRYALATDATPREVLGAAEQAMRDTRGEMLRIAQSMPGISHQGDDNSIIRRALDAVASRHASRQTWFAEARRDLDEAREFVKSKDLLTLPPRDNLQVIETPEFMRGIYSVGGFSPAPPLEPQLGAFYWLTPIPDSWAEARVESKLREYNYYGLQLLTLHEAIPGHYVQLEYSNDIQPPLRRVIRTVFGNGPYIEGWAVYATEAMLDAGYLNHDPALRLTFLKQQLRVFANAILDIRLHTMHMSDDEAVDLMMNQAFQEREEAAGKLQRARLSSAQLPMYFVGWRGWHRVRDRWRTSGPSQSLKDFHDRALKAGAVPLPALARLLTGQSLEMSEAPNANRLGRR